MKGQKRRSTQADREALRHYRVLYVEFTDLAVIDDEVLDLNDAGPAEIFDWEAHVEAANPANALTAFFLAQDIDSNGVQWVDEAGNWWAVAGLGYDPTKKHIWFEGDSLFVYQAIIEEAGDGASTTLE